MGNSATSQTSNHFGKAHCKGKEKDNESRSQSEAVRQIESLLGGEESGQEVTLTNFWLTGFERFELRSISSDFMGVIVAAPQIICAQIPKQVSASDSLLHRTEKL
jgi:hypothetical protein